MKTLTEGKSSSGGRNNNGRITVPLPRRWSQADYRLVDFKRKRGVPAVVDRIEYEVEPLGLHRLIKYEDGDLAYILAPQRLAVGDQVIAGEQVDVKPGLLRSAVLAAGGHRSTTWRLKVGKGGQIARSAGTTRRSSAATRAMIVRLNSGEQRRVSGLTTPPWARSRSPDHMNISLGKAGRNRGWAASLPAA